MGINVAPGIKLISVVPEELAGGEPLTIIIQGTDDNEDSLTIRWIVDDVPQPLFDNLSEFTFEQTPTAQTVYTIVVVVSDGKESEKRTFKVTVLPPGSQSFGVTLYGNANSANGVAQTLTTLVTGVTPGTTEVYKWYIDNALQSGTADTFSFQKSPAAETTYTVRVVVTNGNRTTVDEMAITVLAPGASLPEAMILSSSGSSTVTRVSMSNNWYSYSFFAAVNDDFNTGTTTYTWYIDDVWFYSDSASSYYGNELYLYSTDFPDTEVETLYIIKLVADDGNVSAEDTVEFVIKAEPVAQPVISPGGSSSYYSADISIGDLITITCETEGAAIYYTTDGTDPETSGTRELYEDSFVIPLETTEIRAYAAKTGMDDSFTTIAYYEWVVGAPLITTAPAPDIEDTEEGNHVWFEGPVEISLTAVNPGSLMYYQVSTSTYNQYADDTDTLYETPFTIDETRYIYTRAYLDGWTDSGSQYVRFQITGILSPVEFTPEAGPQPGPVTIYMSCPESEDEIYYTTDGSDPVPDAANTSEYNGGIDITETTTFKAIAVKSDWGDSSVSEGIFEVAPVMDLSIPRYLPLSEEYTTVEFTDEIREAWLSFVIPEEGVYLINLADYYSNEEEDTVDATLRLYEDDGVTNAGDLGNVSSAYPFPTSALLSPGPYLFKITPYSSGTGFCRVRIY